MKIIHDLLWLGMPFFWYGMALLLIGISWSLYRFYKHASFLHQLADARFFSKAFVHYWPGRFWLKYSFLCAALSVLLLVALRPALPLGETLTKQEGRDLFIALDVSRSMLAQDYSPNRLEFAKAKIKQLVDNLACERIGLILFAGSAIVQCPLTTDYNAFFLFLNNVDLHTIASGTTALDKPIKKALEVIEKMPMKKTKLLVIVTDGEDFSSDLGTSKQQAQDLDLHIMTLGIGSEQGAPVPLFDEQGVQEGHQKDHKGNVVISRLNEGILRTLAHDTHGIYLRATQDDTDIKTLVATVQSYEKDMLLEQSTKNVQEIYPYGAALALLFLLVEWWL